MKELFDPKVYIGQAFNILRNIEDAQDAVQNAFVRFLGTKGHEDYKTPKYYIIKLVYWESQEILRNKIKRSTRPFIGSLVSWNDGEYLYDLKVLQDASNATQEGYFKIPYQERGNSLSLYSNTDGKNDRKYLKIWKNSKYFKTIKE